MRNLEPFRRHTHRPPKLYAHRGAHTKHVENTLPAFERAAELQADGVELDVQLCKSGEIVVFHDANLRRLAARRERISSLSWNELEAVDLGRGARIPKLHDVLDLLCGRGLLTNIELKAHGIPNAALARAVAALLLSRSAYDRAHVICSSFNYLALARLIAARIAPVSYLLSPRYMPKLRVWMAEKWPSLGGIHPHFSLVSPRAVQRCHARGLLVNTWTVDDPSSILAAAMSGVDGIITNDVPNALGALLDQGSGPQGT
ncbi:MAG: glycerophosphodiester phosphodiesterase [Myxococcales bacterium]|nr:glycerophosphodiester phosphodiesterase [Myxococcales bacterium]MCB9708002.1 glycerophosphodiester phosphodiesterase [Myxococcales bacterium]